MLTNFIKNLFNKNIKMKLNHFKKPEKDMKN